MEKVTDISNLEDPSSFKNLELARPQKILIEQLIRCHASGKNNGDRSMTDWMQGKGNGLVILLHGENSFMKKTGIATNELKQGPR